ncbi:piwi-like protein Ago3 [Macrosteles quadrilineatus]|uniref:piwi-like protein Ago3 n=1 Tax=Macrosteles quadrilineatus TaxID=74068 RepID=UPI0023E0C1A2|nr:piwi-like protein Ago3 [Macrosteles quadrilineatus]
MEGLPSPSTPLEPLTSLELPPKIWEDSISNCITILLEKGTSIYEYEVTFSSPVGDRGQLDNMLFCQHKDILRGGIFDGVTMYLPHELEVESVTSINLVTNEEHEVTFVYRSKDSLEKSRHFYNSLLNKIKSELKLQWIVREHFSPNGAQTIPQHQLEIWPGNVSEIFTEKGSVKIRCDSFDSVLFRPKQTALQVIDDVIHQTSGNQWKEVVQKHLIGQWVMTRRYNKVYSIDDIDFSMNPTSTFTCADDTEMTYIDYYMRKGIEIRDKNQPLLVHHSKRSAGNLKIILVPENCTMIRRDVTHTGHVTLEERKSATQKWIKNLRSNPRCVKLLEEWGLQVAEILVEECVTLPG